MASAAACSAELGAGAPMVFHPEALERRKSALPAETMQNESSAMIVARSRGLERQVLTCHRSVLISIVEPARIPVKSRIVVDDQSFVSLVFSLAFLGLFFGLRVGRKIILCEIVCEGHDGACVWAGGQEKLSLA